LGEGSFVGEIGENAADAVADGIRSLNSMSSVFDSFVVTNLPDLSLTPGFSGGPFAGLAQAESLAFNARLASNLEGLRASGLEIFEADLNQQLIDIIADPAAFGLTDVVNSCTPSLSVLDPANNCTFTGTGFDVSLADGFLFIDNVHPNTLAHAAVADRIRAEIAPVNLPASMPMIAAGVLALGWVGRRKRG
jgi:outer membrane lipase/esterase